MRLSIWGYAPEKIIAADRTQWILLWIEDGLITPRWMKWFAKELDKKRIENLIMIGATTSSTYCCENCTAI
jgi:hypothetical protein